LTISPQRPIPKAGSYNVINMKDYMKATFLRWAQASAVLALLYPLAAQSQPVQTYSSPGQPQTTYTYSDPFAGRWYVKADAGGTITSDTSLREFFGEDVTGAKVKFDPGYRIGIAAGWEICQIFAVEGEIASMGNRIKDITGADSLDAAFFNIPFLVNAKLQGPRCWIFRPYLGGGVGGSASVISVDHLDLNAVHLEGTDGTVVFAYQGFAGFRVAINEAMGVGFEFRYFHADSPTWRADFSSGTGSDRLSFGQAQTYAFSVVFDWHF
jgi:opacity protein-like surface antigen